MKNCDPDFLEEYHIKDIKNAIDKKDSQNIIKILQGIEELHIKNKCSWLVSESLIYVVPRMGVFVPFILLQTVDDWFKLNIGRHPIRIEAMTNIEQRQ